MKSQLQEDMHWDETEKSSFFKTEDLYHSRTMMEYQNEIPMANLGTMQLQRWPIRQDSAS